MAEKEPNFMEEEESEEIPPQYKDENSPTGYMPSEVIAELEQKREFVDPEKTKKEEARIEKILRKVREKESEVGEK